jgi:hypothetical protein
MRKAARSQQKTKIESRTSRPEEKINQQRRHPQDHPRRAAGSQIVTRKIDQKEARIIELREIGGGTIGHGAAARVAVENDGRLETKDATRKTMTNRIPIENEKKPILGVTTKVHERGALAAVRVVSAPQQRVRRKKRALPVEIEDTISITAPERVNESAATSHRQAPAAMRMTVVLLRKKRREGVIRHGNADVALQPNPVLEHQSKKTPITLLPRMLTENQLWQKVITRPLILPQTLVTAQAIECSNERLS